MIRLITGASILILLILGCSETHKALQNNPEDLIYKITAASCDEDSFRTAIATPIRKDILVSVGHTFIGTKDFTVTDFDGNDLQTEIVFLDNDLDLSLIRVLSEDDINFSRLGNVPEKLETVEIIRIISGKAQKEEIPAIEASEISFLDAPAKLVIELATDVEVGESGSPLLYEDGSLAGIIFATSSENKQTSWAIASEEINNAVKSFKGKEEIQLFCE